MPAAISACVATLCYFGGCLQLFVPALQRWVTSLGVCSYLCLRCNVVLLRWVPAAICACAAKLCYFGACLQLFVPALQSCVTSVRACSCLCLRCKVVLLRCVLAAVCASCNVVLLRCVPAAVCACAATLCYFGACLQLFVPALQRFVTSALFIFELLNNLFTIFEMRFIFYYHVMFRVGYIFSLSIFTPCL